MSDIDERKKLAIAKLRVKVKSLAEESRIIRKEEQKFKGSHKQELQSHRRGIVRYESRKAGLAYAYLKGVPYNVVEKVVVNGPDFTEVDKLVKRMYHYGSIDTKSWSLINETGTQIPQ